MFDRCIEYQQSCPLVSFAAVLYDCEKFQKNDQTQFHTVQANDNNLDSVIYSRFEKIADKAEELEKKVMTYT